MRIAIIARQVRAVLERKTVVLGELTARGENLRRKYRSWRDWESLKFEVVQPSQTRSPKFIIITLLIILNQYRIIGGINQLVLRRDSIQSSLHAL